MNATHCHDGNTFDASTWFAAWSDHGGIVMLIGNRLFVSRRPGLDVAAAKVLNSLRTSIHHPGAATALASLLRTNSGLAAEVQ